MYVFCGFCAHAGRSDMLPSHCEKIHNELPLALTSTKAPVKTQYLNWLEYVENYPKIQPEEVKDYVPHVNTSQEINEDVEKKLNRNDKKFKKHVRFQIEKGMQVNLFDLKHYNDLSTYETCGA